MAQGTNAAESDGPELSGTATSDCTGNNLSLSPISISVPIKCKDNYLNNNNNEILIPTITISKDSLPEGENNENPPAELEFNAESAVAGATIPEVSNAKLPGSTAEDVVDSSRRHSKSSSLPHGVKLCTEAGSTGPPSPDPTEEKWAKIEEQLKQAHVELKEKDVEVEKLKGIRQQVEEELEDLTSSLFLVSPSVQPCFKVRQGQGTEKGPFYSKIPRNHTHLAQSTFVESFLDKHTQAGTYSC